MAGKRAVKYIKRILNAYGKGKHKYIYAKRATPSSKVTRAKRVSVGETKLSSRIKNLQKRLAHSAQPILYVKRIKKARAQRDALKKLHKRLR